MLNVGTPELLLILVVALVVLGPTRLPEVAHQVGRFMAQARRMSTDFQSEVQRAALGQPASGQANAEVVAAPARPPRRHPLVAADAPPSSTSHPSTAAAPN